MNRSVLIKLSLILAMLATLTGLEIAPTQAQVSRHLSSTLGPTNDPCVTSSVGPDCKFSLPANYSIAGEARLQPYIDQLYKVVHSLPGYADIGADYDPLSVELFYYGNLPSSVLPLASQMSREGIGLHQTILKFSPGRMKMAIAKVTNGLNSEGSDWTSIRPNDTYSGLIVGLPRNILTDSSSAKVRALVKSADVDLDVQVVPDEHDELLADRKHDTSPFIGGARTLIGGNDLYPCSTGLAMTNGSTDYILTAGHCTNWTNQTITTGTGLRIGYTSYNAVLADNNHVDSELIVVDSSADTLGGVYVGGYTSNTYNFVQGSGPMARNSSGCIDGSFSGQRCNAMRTNDMTSQRHYCSGICKDLNVFDIASTDGKQIVAGGDSGGPIIRFSGTRLTGLATVTAGPSTNSVKCDANTEPGTVCYNFVRVTPINQVTDALAPFGITVETIS